MASQPRIYVYEVEGRGAFPMDMLRYDRSWPARESEDSFAGLKPDIDGVARRVRLMTINPLPTTGRWESFGWKVVVKAKLVDS